MGKFGIDPEYLHANGDLAKAPYEQMTRLLETEYSLVLDGYELTVILNLLKEVHGSTWVHEDMQAEFGDLYNGIIDQRETQVSKDDLPDLIQDIREAKLGLADGDIEAFLEEIGDDS